MATRRDFDASLTALGLGVVEMIEGFCNRKFAFGSDTHEEEASRVVISVPRYPVAEWSGVDLRDTPGDEWSDISSSVTRYESTSGIIYFRHSPGNDIQSLRVTYTGGFWWDTSEDEPELMPEGAKPLPYALCSAWVMQVQAIAETRDLFGTQAATAAQKAANKNAYRPEAELLPMVEVMLRPFRRFAA